MRLLAGTDFALRVLMLLAGGPPARPVSVERLARDLGGLSRHHLHKIVQDLTALGVTRTLRGTGGGVMLARAPDQIRVGTVLRLLEADQAVVECFRAQGCTCTLIRQCRLRGMLAQAQERFYAGLDAYTLADCIAPATASASSGASAR